MGGGGEITKKKLIEVCEEVSGEKLGQVSHGSALWLIDRDGKRVAAIPNHDHSKALPKPVALDVLKGLTRGNPQTYVYVKSLLLK
jgi:hypothetical protein